MSARARSVCLFTIVVWVTASPDILIFCPGQTGVVGQGILPVCLRRPPFLLRKRKGGKRNRSLKPNPKTLRILAFPPPCEGLHVGRCKFVAVEARVLCAYTPSQGLCPCETAFSGPIQKTRVSVRTSSLWGARPKNMKAPLHRVMCTLLPSVVGLSGTCFSFG